MMKCALISTKSSKIQVGKFDVAMNLFTKAETDFGKKPKIFICIFKGIMNNLYRNEINLEH